MLEPERSLVEHQKERKKNNRARAAVAAANVDAACYDLSGGDELQLQLNGLKLVGEAGGENPEILRDVADRVHHSGESNIQDCIVEDNQHIGIVVDPTGKVMISGTKVRRNALDGVHVEGEVTISDSSVTANGDSGFLACNQEVG